MAIHVIKLERKLLYEIRIDETAEGETQALTDDEAEQIAKEYADDEIFVSSDAGDEFVAFNDTDWAVVSHAKEDPDAGE